MEVSKELHTNGCGLWSQRLATVKVTALVLDEENNELRVYFDTKTWNVDRDGLIYTDPLFERELRTFLRYIGLPTNVHYSEQGMQGDDFVSLDASRALVKQWRELALD